MPKPQTTVQTIQQTRVSYAVGVVMYVAGVTAVLVGLVAAAVSLPAFPAGVPEEEAVVSVVATSTTNALGLTWTAPGDDGATGRAASYDIRYSTAPITETHFASATSVPNRPSPLPAGQTQSLTVAGLQPGTTYYFALKTADEVPNWSAISNIASASTETVACEPSWSCTAWSACASGLETRTCVDNAVCGTDVGRPVGQRTCSAPPAAETCTPDWSCTVWSPCQGEVEVRTCVDRNNCGTDDEKPAEEALCGEGGPGPNEDLLVSVPRQRSPAHIRIFDRELNLRDEFFAFSTRERTGGNIALGDVDGDGELEVVVGSGYGSSPLFRVFSVNGEREASVRPWSSRNRFGLRVAAGDLDGDGVDEIIVSPERGASSTLQVYGFDAARGQYERMATDQLFSSRYREGVNVALDDFDRDGRDELVVVRARKIRPTVFLYTYDTMRKEFRRTKAFNAFSSHDTQGLSVATGDVDNDGDVEIVVAREKGTQPVVRVFDANGKREYQFAAASSRFRGGVTVAALDTDLDGQDEIVTAVASSGPAGVLAFSLQDDGRTFVRVDNVTAYGSGVRYGLRLATP